MDKSTLCFFSTFLLTLLVHRGHGSLSEVNTQHAEDLIRVDNSTHDSLYRQPRVILVVVDSSLNTSDVTDIPTQTQATDTSLSRVRRQAPPNSPLVLSTFGQVPSQGNPIHGVPYVPPLPVPLAPPRPLGPFIRPNPAPAPGPPRPRGPFIRPNPVPAPGPPRPRGPFILPNPAPAPRPPPAGFIEHDLKGTMNVALGRLLEAIGIKAVDILESLTRWKLINLPNFG